MLIGEKKIARNFYSSHSFEGRRVDIERAIEMIARRFPSSRYPQVIFKPINKKIILRQRPPERVAIPPSVAQVSYVHINKF